MVHLGADDIQQLKDFDDDEFKQLCAISNMDKKPFHVMRLRKALNKQSSLSGVVATNHHVPVSVPQPAAEHRATSQPHESREVRQEMPRLTPDPKPGPSKAFLHAINAESYGTSPPKDSHMQASSKAGSSMNKKFYFLPPYLQTGSDSKNFDELVDDQTPVQKTLGPAPFSPSVWDPERAELIRKYASIYGKNFDKRQKEMLTPFEQHVNEAACQLCLRDPTLLVRREELFVLAKRAVKEGGYTYYHGFSKSKNLSPTIGQKRPRDPNDFSEMRPPQMSTLTFAYNIPSKLSSKLRKEHMAELEKLIAENRTQQSVKLAALEKAQQLCDFSTAYSIQLEVEALGMNCEQLQSTYNTLKRRQYRSDRYFRNKQKENPSNDDDDDDSARGNSDVIRSSPSTTLHSSPQIEARSGSSSNNTEHLSLLHQRHSFVDLDKDKASIFPRCLPHRSPSSESSSKVSTVTATILPTTSMAQESKTHTVTVSAPQNSTGGAEVRELVNNVNNATDEVNSIMIHELQKQLNW